jgi:hypothetical protein
MKIKGINEICNIREIDSSIGQMRVYLVKSLTLEEREGIGQARLRCRGTGSYSEQS